ILGIVSLAGIGLAGALGYFVSRAAVAPVERLQRAAEQVANTHDLSRRMDASGTDELAALARSFNLILNALESSLDAQRQLVAHALDSEPSPVHAVERRLERAVANLLDNAVKWSPPGSRIEVRVAGGELSVRDHGPGIAAEDLPHIFDRFYRSAAARGLPGSGLGLAIVRQVAEAHGGTATADAADGGGTVFSLRLPLEPTAGLS